MKFTNTLLISLLITGTIFTTTTLKYPKLTPILKRSNSIMSPALTPKSKNSIDHISLSSPSKRSSSQSPSSSPKPLGFKKIKKNAPFKALRVIEVKSNLPYCEIQQLKPYKNQWVYNNIPNTPNVGSEELKDAHFVYSTITKRICVIGPYVGKEALGHIFDQIGFENMSTVDGIIKFLNIFYRNSKLPVVFDKTNTLSGEVKVIKGSIMSFTPTSNNPAAQKLFMTLMENQMPSYKFDSIKNGVSILSKERPLCEIFQPNPTKNEWVFINIPNNPKVDSLLVANKAMEPKFIYSLATNRICVVGLQKDKKVAEMIFSEITDFGSHQGIAEFLNEWYQITDMSTSVTKANATGGEMVFVNGKLKSFNNQSSYFSNASYSKQWKALLFNLKLKFTIIPNNSENEKWKVTYEIY